MKLRNNFSVDTRELYRDCWSCWQCGGNGQDVGGLEVHHICSRVSNSPLNSSVLCKLCHSKVGHTQEEERNFFEKTMNYLISRDYKLTEKDEQFIREHPYLVINFVK